MYRDRQIIHISVKFYIGTLQSSHFHLRKKYLSKYVINGRNDFALKHLFRKRTLHVWYLNDFLQYRGWRLRVRFTDDEL